MQAPDTRYARSGDLRLAYQEWGEGPPLLIVPALLSNMEVAWEHEYLLRIYDLLGRHMTVGQFDKRGMGLSDRPEQVPSLDERIGDIVAVMDALGWERASLLGISEGGVMAQLFAANCPDRVDKLVLHNTWVAPRYFSRQRECSQAGDPPFLRADELWSRFESLCDGWPECVQEFVDWFMPSHPTTRRSYGGSAASYDSARVRGTSGARSRASSGSTPTTLPSGSATRRSSCM